MSKFKNPTPRNPRKRLTENASDSRIAESNDVWHSTAIEDLEEEGESLENLAPPIETPIRGTGGKKTRHILTCEEANTKKKGEAKSSERSKERGGSANRGGDAEDEENARVVINPPSGHSLLSTVLQKCGYIIRQPASNNEMYKDAIKFRKALADWLQSNNDEMSRIETEASKFLKALDAYLLEKPNFICSMKPTKHDVELIQPSLLHCLLGIEALQPQVLKVVYLFLSEASLSSMPDDVSLVTTILDQMKWLPIKDGQKYLDSLLTIVESASTTCQSAMMKYLPDIIPANDHPQVADKLLGLFNDEGSTLNIALMDCFSSFDIPDASSWTNIKTTAIDQMANAPLQDIPAYFSFLFRGETFQEITEVVTAMREKVNLKPAHRTPKTDAQQVQILEKIGFCITVNSGIVQIWTKQVKFDLQNDLTEDIKKIDLLMLFIFVEAEEPKAVATLKLLFAEKQHVLKLFDELMRENLAMVYQLFTPISKFLDRLMRGRDTKCMETVAEFTVKLFLGLTPIEAQTLMGNMSSILVNYPPSRDTVLQILTSLADMAPTKLLNFAPYLMGVLEYVMQFPTGQIRSLMNVLAVLSQSEGRNPGDSNHFTDEFSILLRKQLTHSDIKIRCFGVYGALACVRRMAAQDIPDEMRIRELLKLAWGYVERDEDACSIFLDELSICVGDLPQDICRTYRDILKQRFQTLWTVDEMQEETIDQFRERHRVNLVPSFDANKECTQDRLLINLENHPMNMSPLVVPAHMRVLALLEEKVEKDLVGIDAILGCPILLPALEEYYDKESILDLKYNQRHHLGQYLTLAINFLRESVCAFVADRNTELRVKVWLRLDNILQLQKLLVKHYDSFPVLPYAYIAERTIGSSKDGGAGPSGLQAFRQAQAKKPPAAEKPKKKAAPKKSSVKKKKARTEVSFESEEEEEERNPAAPASKRVKVILDEEIQPKKIQPFLRRFDLSVFSLLRYPLRTTDEQSVDFNKILLDLTAVSQNSDMVTQVERFSPEVLVLLLAELRRQVTEKRSGLEILKMKRILKYVLSHMHQIQEVLLKNEENDMADVTEYQMRLECCLRLLIDILAAYFEAVKKVEKEDKEKYIQKIIQNLTAQAVQESGEEMGSQAEVMSNVASYLGGFVSVIKDSSTALEHLRLLKNLHDLLEGHSEMKKAIDGAARVYLRGDWKLPSAKVDGFLKIWLGTTKQPIKVINHLADKLLGSGGDEEEGSEDGAIFNNVVYKSCGTANFHTWYNAMLAGLSQFVYKNLRKRGDFDDSIKDWTEAVNIFKSLVLIAQKEPKSKNLKSFILTALLKHCRLFLEAFISGGAELLPHFMKEDKEKAQKFCKALQVPCRVIQHICEHSKIHTDLQLLKSVPLVKRVLETLVFRVREVLGAAGATSAFWMGALKHRDLQGVCISSQIMEGTLDESSDEDVELSSGNEDEDVRAAPLSGMTEEPETMDEDSMDVAEVHGEGVEFQESGSDDD